MHPLHDDHDCIHGGPGIRPLGIRRPTQPHDAVQIILNRDGVNNAFLRAGAFCDEGGGIGENDDDGYMVCHDSLHSLKSFRDRTYICFSKNSLVVYMTMFNFYYPDPEIVS